MSEEYSGGVVITPENFIENIEELEVIKDNQLTDEEIVISLWDGLIDKSVNKKIPPTEQEWIKVVKKLSDDMDNALSVEHSKLQFIKYFKERFGIEPFVSCPLCGKGITRPRKNMYNQFFIGCSEFPSCKYMATRDDRDHIKNELNKLKDDIIQKAEEKMVEVNKLLAMATGIRDHIYTYNDIREIKRKLLKYE
jgi:hypothetical protein